jgi:hypothetical protein
VKTQRIVILCGHFGEEPIRRDVEAYPTKTAGLFVHKTVNAEGIWQGTWTVTLDGTGYAISPCKFRTRADAMCYANLFSPHEWDGVTAQNCYQRQDLRDKTHRLLFEQFAMDRWHRVATRREQ